MKVKTVTEMNVKIQSTIAASACEKSFSDIRGNSISVALASLG